MASILICDDAAFMRETVRNILESEGHNVIAEAEEGQEAVKLYQNLQPDLVTMDILMKDSGVSAIKSIMKINPQAKIIVVSILTDQEGELVEAIKEGALGFVTKPIKKGALVSEVTRVLHK